MSMMGFILRDSSTQEVARRPPRRRRRAPLLIIAWLILAVVGPARAADARPWGTVSGVTDGDLLTIDSPDQGQIRARLYGVDLPELSRTNRAGVEVAGQPFANEAAAYVRNLLLGRQVQIETYGKDVAGRWLSVVWLGEINVNLTLVKEGLAWVAPAAAVPNVRVALEVAERQARVGKYGLWALPDPEPPWEYRKRHRLAFP